MTLGSVPRRRPQPDLRASADLSARLLDTREATSCGRGVAGDSRAREGSEGLHFPTPPATLGSCPAGVRFLETSLCFLLSIPQRPKPRGVTVAQENRSHPSVPKPTRHLVNAPVKPPSP